MKKLFLALVSMFFTVNCFASTFYIDPANGNDSNDGSTWALAWKTITSGATAARIAPGDVIKIAKSPDPTSLGQNATWANGSNTVTLTSAVTTNIDMCDSAWTASTNVTCSTNTSAQREGSAAATFSIASAFTTGKIAYKTLPSTLNLSGYQQISFALNTYSLTPSGVGFTIRLCSDTTGDTVVNSFSIPSFPSYTRQWHNITINYGSALGSSINSVSLAVTSDPGSGSFWVDDIIACKSSSSADSLTLQSLISKNSLAQGGEEPWLPIRSINATSVVLWGASGGCGESSETVPVYKRESFVSLPTITAHVATINDSGTTDNLMSFEGGYNTSTDAQDGETFYDRINDIADYYGLYIPNSVSNVTVDRLNFIRYYRGAQVEGSNNTIKNISVGGNTLGVYLLGNRNIIENLGFVGMQVSGYGITFSGTGNTINSTGRLFGFYNAPGICFSNGNNSIGEVKFLANCMGSSAYGIFFDIGDNVIKKATTSGNSSGGVGTGSAGRSYIKELIASDDIKIAFVPVDGKRGYRLWVDKYQGEADHQYIFTDGGTIEAQKVTRHIASGFAWKFSPGSTRTYSYPLTLSLTKVICFANKLTTVSCYVKKDDASAVGANLVCKGGQIAGVTSDVIATASSGTDWEKLTISFTPTEDGVVDVEGWGYYVSGTSYVYFDDISTAIENSQNINLNSLDYSWQGQPLSVNTATTRSFTWVN